MKMVLPSPTSLGLSENVKISDEALDTQKKRIMNSRGTIIIIHVNIYAEFAQPKNI